MFRKIIKSFYSKYFEYSILLLISSLFFGNAPLSIALVIFLISSIPIVYKNFNIKEFTIDLVFISSCLYFILSLIILSFLSDNFNDVLKIEKLLPFLVFPIVFFSAKQTFTEKFKNKFLKTFVFMAGLSFSLSLIYGIYRMVFSDKSINTIYITYNYLADLFGVQPIYLSIFYLLAMLFCIDLIKLHPYFKKKYLFFSIILFIGIVMLSSRTGIALSIVVISFKLMSVQVNKKKGLLYVLSIIVLGVVLTLSIPTLRNRAIKFNQNVSSYSGLSFRFKIWKNTIQIFNDSPIYGYGFSISKEVLMEQYQTVNFRRAYMNKFNAHNQYLQSLIDTGAVGLLSLLLMLFAPLFYYKKGNKNHLIFIFIILVTLIPESFFVRQNGIVFYCLFNMFFHLFKTDLFIENSS